MKAPALAGARALRALITATIAVLATGCALLRPAAAPSAQAPLRPAIALTVEAPSPLRELLEKHLDLARLQQLPNEERLSGNELNRLIAAAPAQATELLQTEGYFDPQISVQRVDLPAVAASAAAAASEPDSAASAAATPERTGARRVVVVRVQPGQPTQVSQWQVQTDGELARLAAAGDAEAQVLQQRLAGLGQQQAGQVFRNADWAAAKQQLLARLRSAGYAAATVQTSAADIDASERTASLRVTLDSGPLYRSGPVLVRGLVHHDESMVQELAGFGAGTPLTEEHLVAFQDRLQKTRLFQSVQVRYDPELTDTARTPVLVQLVELPLQQATVGVGVSANTGPRTTLEHTHRRPFGWPAVAYNKVEWGHATQSWTADLQSHPGRNFYRNLLGVQIERVVGDTDVVLSQRLRLGRTQDTPRIERLYFLELLRSRQDDLPATGQGPTTAMALSGNLHWVWRDLDSVVLPTRGLTVALQTGAGQAGQVGGQQGGFGRFYGRVTGYLPLGQRWYGQARLEAGQIVRRDAVIVPDALGFRAGGDDSIRGYAYRSLAPLDAGGGTISGESLLTASVELARPILDNLPSVWGAVFVDAGRAVNHWRDYSPAVGWGAGIRWRSPIGPLRIDLARAQELQQWRLHLSVGIAF